MNSCRWCEDAEEEEEEEEDVLEEQYHCRTWLA